jgi:hypothetical protein
VINLIFFQQKFKTKKGISKKYWRCRHHIRELFYMTVR